MLTIDVNHPDAIKFIKSKSDRTKITGANISVKVNDEFMNSLDDNELNNELWKELVHQAWDNAEPGVLFWDKIINESPADCYEGFKSTSTNPCGR